MTIYEILKRPIITEKTTFLAGKRHQYVFEVAPRATKAQVKEAIDAAKQMISWNVVIEIEGVEQLVLRHRLPTHHLDNPRR
jgi:ribosomal protein L23